MGFHRYEVEYTDTFAGQANYSWVRREMIRVPECRSDDAAGRKARVAAIKREAKRVLGLAGHPGAWDEYGDTYEFRPRGMCRVVFVTWQEHVAS